MSVRPPQRNYRLAIRAHREALVAVRSFWQYLLNAHITFTHLSKAFGNIDKAVIKVRAANVHAPGTSMRKPRRLAVPLPPHKAVHVHSTPRGIERSPGVQLAHPT